MKQDKRLFPPSKRNLDKYDVLVIDDYENPQYLQVGFKSNILSYGKHSISILMISDESTPYKLRMSSDLQIEVKDINDNIINYKLNDNNPISNLSYFSIHIDEDLFNTYEGISDGKNNIIITILGELTDNIQKIPNKWVGVYNVKIQIPLSIEKNLENTSPLYFNENPTVFVGESIHYDTDSTFVNRSYADILIDNIDIVGGQLKYIESSMAPLDSYYSDRQLRNIFEIEKSSIETLTKHAAAPQSNALDNQFDTGPGGYFESIGYFSGQTNNKNFGQEDNWRVYESVPGQVTTVLNPGVEEYISIGPKPGNQISKIFRKSNDDYEEYEISFIPSGSCRVEIWETSLTNQTYLTQSLSQANFEDPRYLIYSQSVSLFDPKDNQTWTSSYTQNGGNLLNSNIVSESTSYITGSFIISPNHWACIYVYNSEQSLPTWAHIGNISIVPKIKKGYSPPFYFNKTEIPPLISRRNKVHTFNFKFLDSNRNSGKYIYDDNIMSVSASNTFTGSSITFENSDTLFIASASTADDVNLKQVFLIADHDAGSRAITSANVFGVFYDTTKQSLVFGKDNLNKNRIEFNQSGSNSFMIISGSEEGSTYLKVVSGSKVTTIYPGKIETENYIISSSVTYMTSSFISGSSAFGDSLDDIHSFTGSLNVSNSLTVAGDISASGDTFSKRFIGGKYDNTISADSSYSSILGGYQNTIIGSDNSIIGGGYQNTIEKTSHYSIIGAGQYNVISGSTYSIIGAGSYNKISSSYYSAIVAGRYNTISGSSYSIIGSGYRNTISGSNFSMIGAGYRNAISASEQSIIGAGGYNAISGSNYSIIGSGYKNKMFTSHYSIIGAGWYNRITSSHYSIIGAGYKNTISGSSYSIIGAGQYNTISGSLYSIIGAGNRNIISGSPYSIIGAGKYNTMSGSVSSSILGGMYNHIPAYDNVHIIGSNISASQANTTFTENIIAKGSISASGDYHLKHTRTIYWDSDGSNQLSINGTLSQFAFGSGSTVMMRISGSDGNAFLGIGTNSIPKTLTVAGDISASGDLYLDGVISASDGSGLTVAGDISASDNLYGSELHLNDLIISGTAGGNIYFKNIEAGDSYQFLGDSSGNKVLLKISDYGQGSDGLEIVQGYGQFTLSPVTDGNNMMIGARGGSLYFGTTAGTIGRITGSYWGIGSSTVPTKTLTVEGDISASGDFIVGDLSSNFVSMSNGHISASGTISASAIYADTIYTSGSTLYVGGTAFNEILLKNIKRGYSSTGLSPVGMSDFTGDISASNTVFADTGSFNYLNAPGAILGYSMIRNEAGNGNSTDYKITLNQTSFTLIESVAGTKAGVIFIAPPSRNVEVEFCASMYNSQEHVFFGLSTSDSSYTEIEAIHTYDNHGNYYGDETDRFTLTMKWIVEGLTAGTSYTYYVWYKVSAGTAYIYHGESTHHFATWHMPPVITKVTALPATFSITGD